MVQFCQLALAICFCLGTNLLAQTPSDVERRVADLEEQLAALKAELKKEPLPPTVAGLDRALQPVSITGISAADKLDQ